MTWLEDILLTRAELESPQSFWKWSALAAISAVVKDNIWFNKQIYNLYPNIYVMLHADSGLKKGPPIAMANRFVAAINNTHIIQGRSSIQAILKEMGTPKSMPGGGIQVGSNCFICSSELTSSIVSDPVAMDILTDIFDRHYRIGEWKSLLKMETFTLKNPCLTMLSGTNEAHSEGFFERKDIQGGYFARTFIIHEKKRNKINSLMFKLKNPPDETRSINYLRLISQLKGGFEMADSTREYFDKWYNDFCNTIDTQGIKDSTGTLNRFDDSILKVAMLISLASSPELVITQKAIEEAISECEKLVGNVRKVTLARGGKSVWSTQKALIIQELIDRDNHTISRQMVNKKYYLHANSNEWDEIGKSLADGGHIKIENEGSMVMWRMPDEAVAEWKKHLSGKDKV